MLYKEAGTSDEAFQGGLKRDCDEHGNVLPDRRTADGQASNGGQMGAHPLAHASWLSRCTATTTCTLLRIFCCARRQRATPRSKQQLPRTEPPGWQVRARGEAWSATLHMSQKDWRTANNASMAQQ